MGPDSEAPNWEAVQEEICCPLCDYNLRGLIEPRCPECGYSFAWPDLIDPSRRLHPYLFEHHPERRAWSFRRTLTAGLRPRRFWKALHPAQPSYPRLLILYWALAMLPLFLTILANVGGLMITIRRENKGARISAKAWLTLPRFSEDLKSTLRQYGSIDNYLNAAYPVDWTSIFPIVCAHGENLVSLCTPAGMFLVCPWLTLLSLFIFQISMMRARVRRVHVLRCVCYSADIGFWFGLAIILTVLNFACNRSTTTPTLFLGMVNLELLACALAVLIFSYRLIIAYRSYLHFPRSVWVVLAAQVIGFLLFLLLTALVAALSGA
jgi:hypothetical protein